jgi:hypothetical protein
MRLSKPAWAATGWQLWAEVKNFPANWKGTSSGALSATSFAQVGSQLPAESKILNPA